MNTGDILCGTYCYSSIFPIFLRVVKTTPASVYVERLGKQFVSSDGYGQNGMAVPNFDKAVLVNKRFKVCLSKSGEYIKYDDVVCHLWDGTAQMVSTD